jgi:hypothetical protein
MLAGTTAQVPAAYKITVHIMQANLTRLHHPSIIPSQLDGHVDPRA